MRGVERRDGAKVSSIRAYQARNAPLRSGASAPFGAPRRRFLAGGRSVTGHGAGVGGTPRAPWDPGCEPGVLGRRCSAPPQDRLMMAPLIERNAPWGTCCLLSVNNFYFRTGNSRRHPRRRRLSGQSANFFWWIWTAALSRHVLRPSIVRQGSMIRHGGEVNGALCDCRGRRTYRFGADLQCRQTVVMCCRST
jgi:hypothetical protein